jgi:hypothetical protein
MSRSYSINGTVTDEIAASVDMSFDKWFVTATYYSDEYVTEVTPTSGTITVYGKLPGAGSSGTFDGTIDCTDSSSYVYTTAPLEIVSAVPSGITGATHYKLTATGTKG